MEEEEGQGDRGACVLRLEGGARLEDSGFYDVMFPRRMEDNVQLEVRVTDSMPQVEDNTWIYVVVGVGGLMVVVGIIYLIWKCNKQEYSNEGTELRSGKTYTFFTRK